MKLAMYLGHDLIVFVPLSPELIIRPGYTGYIRQFVRQLKKKMTCFFGLIKNNQQFVNEAIEQLPPQQKKVFILSRQQGLSHPEIAEELKLSSKTVNNHLTEALRFIKQYLQNAPGASFTLLMILLRIKG